MTKPFETWTVLPHGKLKKLDDNLITVTGELQMPLGTFERRMTVVRLNDGRLVVYSAIALAEPEMAELEAFGTPAFLVVPHGNHRLDARIWKQRYPQMQVIAVRDARDKVAEVVDVDATEVDFGDPSVRFVEVPGTDGKEGALVVEGPGGTSIIVSDLIFNLANRPGLSGWLFKMMGMTGTEPHMPGVVKLREVGDKRALAATLAQWARLPNLRRIIPAHGNVIEQHPAAALGTIARDIAA